MAWGYKASITVDNTKVSTSNHTSFPMLVAGTYDGTGSEPDLRTVANGGKVRNANGYDIAFFSDSALTTQLDHEVETYTAATGVVAFWVRIPTLHNGSADVIYMAYGDAGISTSQENITSVWDTNYKAVYHLNTDLLDSTSNNHDLTNQSSTDDSSGMVGHARAFAGSQYLTASDSADWTADADITWQAWAKFTNFSTYRALIGTDATASHILWLAGSDGSRAYFDTDTPNVAGNVGNTGSTMSSGTWYLLTGVRSGNDWIVYLNGVSQDSYTVAGDGFDTSNFSIGRLIPYTSFDMVGSIDEVRISKGIARSAGWQVTEYNNISSPSTFYTMGTETALSTGFAHSIGIIIG